MIEDDDILVLADRARKYAALSGEFQPVEAVKAAFGSAEFDPPVAARVMGFLRADCTVAADGKAWIMRQSPRDKVLSKLGPDGLAESAEWNLPEDALAVTMRSTLAADPEAVTSEINAVLADPTPDLERVDTLARAIELAGSATGKAIDLLPALQGTLNRHSGIRRADEQLAQGYYGNEALRERLGRWIDSPYEASFARALYIRGIPGVGKSFLLTKLVQEARERTNPIVLLLDFDRRGLNLVELDGLTMELARQLGNELPDSAVELAQLRARDSGESQDKSSKRGPRSMSYALVEAMGRAVQSSGRNVLLVLDTLEVLASYGSSHPRRLFEYLDDLLNLGVAPTAIIAAGRGEALDSLDKRRIEDVQHLTGLPDRVARQILERLETPSDAILPILEMAHGNPLILRLAAKLAREGGAEAVALENVEGEAPEVAGGYLYRAILSRIEGEDLCRIANLGLVMQRIDAGAIAEVIAPALEMSITLDQAGQMLEQLSTHHWLVENEPGGWVRHRSDVREVVLRLLYANSPVEVVRVNAGAAKYLADKDPKEALYHRLQALGPNEPLPEIRVELAAQFTEQMIAELRDREADAVLQARGERSRSGRGDGSLNSSPVRKRVRLAKLPRSAADATEKRSPTGASNSAKASAFSNASPSIPPSALTDLRFLLEKGDLVEADKLFQSTFKQIPPVTKPAGVAAMCHLWLSGQWSKAEQLFRQCERRSFRHARWEGAEALVNLAILEMQAEFDFDALVDSLGRNDEVLWKAHQTYREARTLRLNQGALAYALLAVSRDMELRGSLAELASSAGTGLQDSVCQEQVLREASDLRERHRIPSQFDPAEPWEIAANLNPYSAPVASLVALKASPKLTEYMIAVSGNFSAMARVPFDVDDGNTVGGRLLSRSEVMVEQLAALGSTADWLSGFAFFHQVANVPLIARRAEAWRRAAAGEWVYGSNAPEGWVEMKAGLDHGTRTWIERLLSVSDPADEAARQLLFWHEPMPDKEQGEQPMGKRSSARLAQALRFAKRVARRKIGSEAPYVVARALIGRNIGRSIAVPVAVLAAQRGGRGTFGPSLERLARLGGEAVTQILQQED